MASISTHTATPLPSYRVVLEDVEQHVHEALRAVHLRDDALDRRVIDGQELEAVATHHRKLG
jgi:hypothetical protein